MAAYPTVSFYYPPLVTTLTACDLLDSINVSYTSTFPDDNICLYLQCSENGPVPWHGFLALSDVSPTAPPNAPYTVNLTQVLGSKYSGKCHFQLVILSTDSAQGNNSISFNVSENSAYKPITWGLSMTMSTSSSSPSTITLMTSSPNTAVTSITVAPSSSVATSSSIATSSSVTPSVSVVTVGLITSTSSPASSKTGPTPNSQHSLSTAAIAGIAVVATLSAVGFMLLSVFLWRRRRGRKTASEKVHVTETSPVKIENTNEMEGDFMPTELLATERPPELDGTAVSELHGSVPLE